MNSVQVHTIDKQLTPLRAGTGAVSGPHTGDPFAQIFANMAAGMQGEPQSEDAPQPRQRAGQNPLEQIAAMMMNAAPQLPESPPGETADQEVMQAHPQAKAVPLIGADGTAQVSPLFPQDQGLPQAPETARIFVAAPMAQQQTDVSVKPQEPLTAGQSPTPEVPTTPVLGPETFAAPSVTEAASTFPPAMPVKATAKTPISEAPITAALESPEPVTQRAGQVPPMPSGYADASAKQAASAEGTPIQQLIANTQASQVLPKAASRLVVPELSDSVQPQEGGVQQPDSREIPVTAAYKGRQTEQEQAETPQNLQRQFESAVAAAKQRMPKNSEPVAEVVDVDQLQSRVDLQRSTGFQVQRVQAQPEEPKLAQQLNTGITQNLKAGSGEFTMKLKPEALGEITVRFAEKDGKTQVSILTASAQTAKLINQELTALREALRPMQAEVYQAVPQAQESPQSQMSFDMAGQQFAGGGQAFQNRGDAPVYYAQAEAPEEETVSDEQGAPGGALNVRV